MVHRVPNSHESIPMTKSKIIFSSLEEQVKFDDTEEIEHTGVKATEESVGYD